MYRKKTPTHFLWKNYLKRLFDIILAIVSVIIFSPVIIVIGVVIKLKDGGNVIFSQERIGLKGKPFILYKFRTMRMNAETHRPQLWSKNDNRVTRLGAFLRGYHLDEFPQLWNVIRGDMSFVGYRPERKYFIDKIMENNSDYELLYEIRPGLFSEATLYNGYTNTMEKMLKRLEMDLDYLQKISCGYDLKIIFLTAFSILFGKKI